MRELGFLKAVARIERAEALDPIIEKAGAFWRAVLQPRALRDVLHGVPFGHPIHPVEVMVPIGAWTSVAVLDLVPGSERATRTLVGLGVLGALPSVLSGWADWSELRLRHQRVGLVHSSANATAIALYTLSYLRRRNGASGRLLAYAGFAVVGAAGYLGGHLAYRQAAGVTHTDDVLDRFPDGWHAIGAIDELPDGTPVRRVVDAVPLVVVRRGTAVDVLADTCTHMSASLSGGELLVEAGEACIACPLHDSVFSLRTGEALHGPAVAPQPVFAVRQIAGTVEVSLH